VAERRIEQDGQHHRRPGGIGGGLRCPVDLRDVPGFTGRQRLQEEEAVLLRRDVGRPLPGGERDPVGKRALGIAERGQAQRCRAFPGREADHQVLVERDVAAREDEVTAVAPERERARRGGAPAAFEVDAHAQRAGHGRLTVGRPQGEAELAPAPDERHLLLELHLETLGGPRRDGGHAHGEEGAAGRPARGRTFSRRLLFLLALLQQAGVDALGGQLPVDGARPLLLEDHAGDADEAVPDREVADRRRGRQREAIGPLLHVGRMVLVHLADVDPRVAARDPDVDGHLAQG
jgi:hypothetical protein